MQLVQKLIKSLHKIINYIWWSQNFSPSSLKVFQVTFSLLVFAKFQAVLTEFWLSLTCKLWLYLALGIKKINSTKSCPKKSFCGSQGNWRSWKPLIQNTNFVLFKYGKKFSKLNGPMHLKGINLLKNIDAFGTESETLSALKASIFHAFFHYWKWNAFSRISPYFSCFFHHQWKRYIIKI